MELIDKAKVYNYIAKIEQRYRKECCSDMDMATYRTLQRMLSDISSIKFFVADLPAEITTLSPQSLVDACDFSKRQYIASPEEIAAALKMYQEQKDRRYECIQCGRPIDLPYGICKECRDEAAQQRDEYIQHCIKEASKNETHS